jgi:hypothetical protein
MVNKINIQPWLGIMVAGAFILAACNGQANTIAEQLESPTATLTLPANAATEEPEDKVMEAPTEPIAPSTEVPTTEPTESPTEAPTDLPEPAPTELIFVPSTRTALEATNPATVSLASGQLQLVEFFAYW